MLNQTGIEGRFDFAIDYDSNADAPGAFSGAVGPGMFRAFQDQLGLKREATRGLVDVLVIDRTGSARPPRTERQPLRLYRIGQSQAVVTRDIADLEVVPVRRRSVIALESRCVDVFAC